MSEWVAAPLGEIANIAIGGTPARDNQKYWDSTGQEGYPWVSIADLGSRFVTNTKEKITDDGVRFSNVKPVTKDTLLLSFKLTIGRAGIAGRDLFTNEAIAAIKPLPGTVSPKFLYYVLPSIAKNSVTDTAIKGVTLNKQKLASLVVHFPKKIGIQESIADILETVDVAIEKTEALIAKYQQIKAGLMHDLFTRGVTADGKLRPPRDQAPELYQETPLGWIPKEWKVRQLHELGDVITGNTPPEHAFSGDGRGIPFVTPGDVGNAIFVSETVRSVTPGLAGMARLITPNATCVVCIGSTIGKLALVSGESITNQQINSVLCQKRELSFLAYFSMSYFLPSQLRREAGLQAVPIVKKSVFEKLLVAWPIAPEEAMEVQNKLLAVAVQLEAEEAVACKLHQQKYGLMHDLLTGHVRALQKAAEVTL